MWQGQVLCKFFTISLSDCRSSSAKYFVRSPPLWVSGLTFFFRLESDGPSSCTGCTGLEMPRESVERKARSSNTVQLQLRFRVLQLSIQNNVAFIEKRLQWSVIHYVDDPRTRRCTRAMHELMRFFHAFSDIVYKCAVFCKKRER